MLSEIIFWMIMGSGIYWTSAELWEITKEIWKGRKK